MRLKVFAAFCLTLLFAAVCAAPGDPAHAQRARRRGQQASPAAPSGSPAPQQDRPKNIIVGRGADTARGSRMTITSDNPLNDYSAYRSGDRFYVELPNANADTVARAAGKGFSDMQVQRRGKNVVLSYRVRPGAKPRVEQRFNRLEVVFEVPEGGEARAAQEQPAAPAGGNQTQAAQNPPANQPATPASAQNPPGDRRTPTTPPAAGQTAGAPGALTNTAPAEMPTAAPPATAEQAPTPVEQPAPAGPQPGATELAQALPPAPAAPSTATTGPAAGSGSGASVGAFLLRNWTMVIVAALLLIGVGLLIAARRSSAPSRTPAGAAGGEGAAALKGSSAPKLKGAGASAASVETGAAVAASLAAAKAAATESKKAAKKSKKAQAAEVVREEKKAVVSEVKPAVVTPEKKTADAYVKESAAVAAPEQPVAAAEAAVKEVSVEEPRAAEAAAEAPAVVEASTVETAEVAPYVAGVAAAEEVTAESAAPEVKGIEAVAPVAPLVASKELAPAAAFDPDRARDETKLLLEGSDYDRGVISTRDAMARQMVAAELLSALSGRNAERRERARAAFVEHGYFDEMAEDLRTAEAGAERASAARALGLVGDRSATPHLVGALEDSAVEVRRAAVESLASLRDPAAVAPLEALLRREKKSKTKVNRKLVEHAIETCREGVDEEAVTAAPAVAEPAEVAAEEKAAAEYGVTAAEELGLFVEEPAAEVAPVEAEAEAAPARAEIEPAEPSSLFESRAAVEEVAGVEETPTVETPPLVAEVEAETVEVAPPAVFEEVSPAAAESVSAEEAVEEERVEVEAAGSASPVGLAEVEPAVEEVVEVAAPPAAEERVAAGYEEQAEDWVELDVNELDAAPPPASAGLYSETFETSTDEPAAAEPPAHEQAAYEPFTFEPTAFEPAAFEPAAIEPAPVETLSEETRPAEASAEFAAAPEAAAAPRVEEKGVAPFDEYSSVPANIQQRLASASPEERAAAVTELARVDTGEAFHQVCVAFDDEAKEVRSAAARALYDMQGDRAESFTRALREAGPDRRRNIGAAISSSGLASDAISQLTGESREKTYEAFSLLFLMAKAGEVTPLVRAIEGHPNSEVRLAVVKLLALSGQKEILPAFRRLAVRGSLPTEVRSAVMEAIYQISSQSETTPAA